METSYVVVKGILSLKFFEWRGKSIMTKSPIPKARSGDCGGKKGPKISVVVQSRHSSPVQPLSRQDYSSSDQGVWNFQVKCLPLAEVE